MSTRRTAWGAAAVAALAILLTSCVRVPDTGPVVAAKEPAQAAAVGNPYNDPPPPTPGATPDQIVSGFFDAMTATPLQTRAARKYLVNSGTLWQPQRNVVTYSRLRSKTQGDGQVTVRLQGADRIGVGGRWLGRLTRAASQITFPMRKENGEWRIASAPNALIVPRSFYLTAFQDASVYFFDPTGRILVPEPVHVPQGSQLASSLVKSLLLGPRTSLGDVVRTFIPSGLAVDLSVIVDRSLAQVSLKGTDPGLLSPTTTHLMLAQLAWTLRQDPSINAFTLTIAGRPVTDATGSSRFQVDDKTFNEYDPAVATASGQTYALRRGRLVSGPVNDLTKVEGPFGATRSRIGPFAVNLDSTQVAGVTPDSLLLAPMLGTAGPTPVLTGPGLLRPSWDFADRLWTVQDELGRATVSYVAQGRRHQVQIPGITGKDVRRFLISRDGSRIVALLRGPGADRIVTSRIRYDADGHAIGATHAQPIRWRSRATSRLQDIGWTTPTTIAVLDQLSAAKAEVRILNVDGSTRPDQAPPTQVPGLVRGLATAPGQTPYAVLHSVLSNISPDQVQTRQIPIPGLRHVTYAG